MWSTVGFAGSQTIRFAANLILTRLVSSEAFGLLSLIAVLLQGLQLFSDFGIGPSIIQNRRGTERRFLNTAFSMQVLRGLTLAVCASVLAAPFAAFYGDPRLKFLVPILAFITVIQGFQSTKLFTANRELALKQLSLVELTAQGVGAVVMVGWALIDRSIAALVAGTFATHVTKTVLSHLVLPGSRNRFEWDSSAVRELFRFGRWILVSTAFTFLAGQSDRLIFGKLVPMGLLGIYGIAAMVAALPCLALTQLSTSVFFPLYSGVVARGEDLLAEMRRTRAPLLLAGGWAHCGLVAGGPTAFRLLYDDTYLPGGWILQWLALGAWFLLLENLNATALLARGKTRWNATSTALKFLAMLALIPIGHRIAGFPGAVAAVTLSEVVRYLVSVVGLRSERLRVWPRDLGLTLLIFAVAAPVRWLAHKLTGQIPTAVEAAIVTVLVTLPWAALGWPYLRRGRKIG
jgi:O-antigen/teichoic acid export membrane protein